MSPVKVLFVAADPSSAPPGSNVPRLLLDEDVRSIRAKVRAAEHRDALVFDFRLAARPGDLLQGLNEVRPQVVHFSGHGGREGVEVVGSDGQAHPVSAEALVRLFEVFRGDIRLVVLNACHSLPHARAIANAVGCAIGNPRGIPDTAAIVFGGAFYSAVAFGHSVQVAYDQARAALLMEGFFDGEFPQLVTGAGVDASRLVLVAPNEREGADGRDARETDERRGRVPRAGQNVSVQGNGNVVTVAGRDLHVSPPPPARPPPAESFVTVSIRPPGTGSRRANRPTR
jgi:hypothetical protein